MNDTTKTAVSNRPMTKAEVSQYIDSLNKIAEAQKQEIPEKQLQKSENSEQENESQSVNQGYIIKFDNVIRFKQLC